MSPAMEYFAQVSQKAYDAKPPFRGLVSMHKHGDYILIKSEIAGEIERRWFHQLNPIFYYYLPKEVRLPLVQEMYCAGNSLSEIAELIGLSKSTISADITELKKRFQTDGMIPIKPRDVTPAGIVLKSTIQQKPQSFTQQYIDSY
jgi:hypothetical protein